MEKVVAIVPAAGAGKRLGLGINKAFAKLAGAPLLVHCLHMLEKTKLVTEAIVVLAPAEVEEGEQLLTSYQPEYFPALPIKVVAGGRTAWPTLWQLCLMTLLISLCTMVRVPLLEELYSNVH